MQISYLGGNFYFLALPRWPFLTHLVMIPGPTSPSLTTIVKRQVAAVASCSMDFFPLLYNQHSPSGSAPSLTSDLALRCQVEAKLADGDVTGAVRLTSSNDTLAPFDGETLSGLWYKHPLPS